MNIHRQTELRGLIARRETLDQLEALRLSAGGEFDEETAAVFARRAMVLKARAALPWTKAFADHPRVHWGQSAARAAPVLAGLVYLATPYTRRAAPDGRFSWAGAGGAAHDAAVVAARLARHGVTAASPIVQAHQMVRVEDDSDWALDARFWTDWCRPLLDASVAVYVPVIAGWDASDGIAHEVRYAVAAGKRVFVEAATRPGA